MQYQKSLYFKMNKMSRDFTKSRHNVCIEVCLRYNSIILGNMKNCRQNMNVSIWILSCLLIYRHFSICIWAWTRTRQGKAKIIPGLLPFLWRTKLPEATNEAIPVAFKPKSRWTTNSWQREFNVPRPQHEAVRSAAATRPHLSTHWC